MDGTVVVTDSKPMDKRDYLNQGFLSKSMDGRKHAILCVDTLF